MRARAMLCGLGHSGSGEWPRWCEVIGLRSILSVGVLMATARAAPAQCVNARLQLTGEIVWSTKVLNRLNFWYGGARQAQGELAPLVRKCAPDKTALLARRVPYVEISASDMTERPQTWKRIRGAHGRGRTRPRFRGRPTVQHAVYSGDRRPGPVLPSGTEGGHDERPIVPSTRSPRMVPGRRLRPCAHGGLGRGRAASGNHPHPAQPICVR